MCPLVRLGARIEYHYHALIVLILVLVKKLVEAEYGGWRYRLYDKHVYRGLMCRAISLVKSESDLKELGNTREQGGRFHIRYLARFSNKRLYG